MADGATQLVAELIGEAFIDAIRQHRGHSLRRVGAAWRWLKHAAKAPPGMRLVSADGNSYSGLVLVDHNDAVVLVALCHPPTSRVRAWSHGDAERGHWSDYDPSERLPFED